jgi:hypothetical protein
MALHSTLALLSSLRRRRFLASGFCSSNPVAFDVLRKMKPMRQVEVAELMVSVGNFTSAYAQALLAATRQHDLVHANKPKKVGGMTSEQMARMVREMESLTQDFKALEESYGDDVLHLVIASGYLSRLVANPEILGYLRGRHPDILDEFQAIIAATSLDRPNGGGRARLLNSC